MSYQEIERRASQKKHERTVGELNAQIEHLLKERGILEKRVEEALSITGGNAKPISIKAKKGAKSESVAFAIASDWHVEETIKKQWVSGLNEFSLEIADARIQRFFRGVVKLTDIQRGGSDIDTLCLFLGGDLMTGYIHEELEESNGLSPVETVLWLFERVAGGIEYLKREGGFSRIIIPCCHGNHGRTGKKPRVSTSAANSYEWMLYKFLEQSIGGVEWHVADGYHIYADFYGKAIRFHHGDAIRYSGGVGGLTIPTNKKIAEWDKAKPAHLDVFGHYHQYQQSPKWCSNGSLIGYGPYSVRIGAGFEPPQQTYFLFDKDRGRTITCPIFCEGHA
jgi:hypothetical protein